MPHECTNCGRAFEDGSKEMLSGCPDCGGTKFQFVPAIETGATARSSSSSAQGSQREADRRDRTGMNRPHPGTDDGSRSWPSTGEPSDDEAAPVGEFAEWPDSARRPEDRSDADEPASNTDELASNIDEPTSSSDRSTDRDGENTAQADARSSVASPDELPEPPEHSSTPSDPEYGHVVSEPDDAQPSLEELREELNDQFESIRIVNPGQYELNLMELYNREEYIVSLQEDGRYVIDVPDSWHEDGE